MTEIETILDARAEELRAIDDVIFGETIGVAQASDQLRDALDAIDRALDDRRFEAAAGLGYGDIASAFIFLQRTLAGLQSAEHRRDALISDIAALTGQGYEDVAPRVAGRLKTSRPKSAEQSEGHCQNPARTT